MSDSNVPRAQLATQVSRNSADRSMYRAVASTPSAADQFTTTPAGWAWEIRGRVLAVGELPQSQSNATGPVPCSRSEVLRRMPSVPLGVVRKRVA